jgi:hypothetical protein
VRGKKVRAEKAILALKILHPTSRAIANEKWGKTCAEKEKYLV